jgi:hypothetical protein
MRRFVLVVLTAVVGSLTAAVAAGAQTPAQDSVTGSGVSNVPGCSGPFEVNAQSGPSGENPTGQVHCGTLFSGPVTCLNVSGNVGLLTVQDSVFGQVGVRITDGGPMADHLEALLGAGCPTPLGSYLDFDFTGDIVVVDAQSPPTSKDQCKNGGWRNFGVFKNQGDCVSFVVTKGKNLPAKAPS